MNKELEALEKINHTLCLNSHRIEFGVDEDSIDCKNIEEFVECYNTIRKYLTAHKDIEKELGIDLITLFKAVKNGFYDNEENYYKPYDYLIDLESSCLRENFEDYIKAKTFRFEDYGKTWSLTREELL